MSRAVARGRRRAVHLEQAECLDWRLAALDFHLAERLDLHRVADELVRLGSDQDLARLGRLLEASCHVHRVPGDQPLAGRRITRHHLAGRDPCPPRDRRSARGAGCRFQRFADLRRGTHRAQRVVLVHARDAERPSPRPR